MCLLVNIWHAYPSSTSPSTKTWPLTVVLKSYPESSLFYLDCRIDEHQNIHLLGQRGVWSSFREATTEDTSPANEQVLITRQKPFRRIYAKTQTHTQRNTLCLIPTQIFEEAITDDALCHIEALFGIACVFRCCVFRCYAPFPFPTEYTIRIWSVFV